MNWLARLGTDFVRPGIVQSGLTLRLAGGSLARVGHIPRRLPSLLQQMYQAGVKAFHVLVLVSFFIGMVVSLQVGFELARFGQEGNIGLLVSVTMAREMAPFVVAILLAASSGSAMAAELGTMKVQEEVTALEVLSVDVVSYLVLPRVAALTLMAPILTFFAVVVGVFGGGVIAVTQLGLDFDAYLRMSLDSLREMGEVVRVPRDLFGGLVKSVVFGFAISIIGCAQGLTARNGAAGVGLTTRAAVRDAFIVVIILNFLMGKVIWH